MRPPWGPGGPRGWCHCLLQDLEWEGVVLSSPAWGPVAPLQPRRLSQQLRPHRGKGSPRWQLPSPSCLSLDAASLPSRVGEGPHPSFGLALFTPPPSQKPRPLLQSTIGSPASFPNHRFLSQPRSLDEHGLQFMRELPAPRPVLTSPCFSLRCLASARTSPSKEPSSSFPLLQAIYGLRTSLSKLLSPDQL